MPHRFTVPALAGALALVAPGTARAQYFVQICAEYNVVLDDASAVVGDDFFTDSNPKPAVGGELRVISQATGNEVHRSYLQESGTDAGCMSQSIGLGGEAYTVELRTKASINGNMVYVRPEGMPNGVYVYSTSFTPTAAGVHTVTTGQNPMWNLAAVAGESIQRRPAGLSGKTINVFNIVDADPAYIAYTVTDPSLVQDACPGADTGDVCVHRDARYRKYIIAHEVGHAVAMNANADLNGTPRPWNNDYNASAGNCPSFEGWLHDMYSQEWGSAAAGEGTAHAFAAAVFNKTSESDCYFWDYKRTDPDHDGQQDTRLVTCAGPFTTTTSQITFDSADYYGDVPCTGVGEEEANHGTPFDWLRFWWAMMAEEGLWYRHVMDIWVEAEPHTWWATGDNYGFTHPDFPSQRIKDAAHALTYPALDPGAAYDNQSHHGVDR